MYYYIMLLSLLTPSLISGTCIDIHSHIVSQGLHYVPGPNSCTLCICDKGNPKWCKSVLCSPPQDCTSFQMGTSCCEFKCLDDILNKTDNYSDTYDMALRLIASLVTAVLSISLLFFLIHRLRQRKIRLRQNSQLNDDHHSFNGIGYITGSLGYLSGSMGYLSSTNNDIEYHYNDANYPLWKPSGNYFPRGEAPPPYEEAVRAARTEQNLLNVNTNLTPFSFTTNGSENVSLTLVHNTHVNITPNVQNQSIEPVENSQYSTMMLQTEQHNEPVTLDDHQISNNSNTNVRLVCRQSTGKNCTVNSSSTLVQNAMVVNQVDVHSDNGMSLPIVMVASNKNRPESEHIKGSYFNSKSDISNIPHQMRTEKNFKSIPNISTSSSKNSSCDTRTLNKKLKNCNVTSKELVRKTRSSSNATGNSSSSGSNTGNGNGKLYLKDCETKITQIMECNQSKSNTLNPSSSYINGTKHRTIPHIYSTSMNIPTDPEIWAAEEINERKNLSKDQSNCYKTCSHSVNLHESSGTTSTTRKGDISLHCTLPKTLRDLNNTFNLNFNYLNSEEQKNDSEQRDASLPTTALLMKGNKDDNNCELFYTNIETLKNKLYTQQQAQKESQQKQAQQQKHQQDEHHNVEKKSTSSKYKSSSQKSTLNRPDKIKSTSTTQSQPEILKEDIPRTALQSLLTREGSSSIDVDDVYRPDGTINQYYCTSPIQDLDDYRSECENCKSLSFENCNEEMDVLNETMTLQRHPVEQDENQMYYRTSLTLPSHSKKVRSVMLNTARESWFMAMQEITSSSDSD